MPKTDKPTQKATLASHNAANDNGAALTVSYRWDEGLLVCGQTRAYKDAIKSARVRLQRLRFSRWLPEDCAWYLPNSRRKPLAEQVLRALADHLRAQGVPSVAVRYDPAPVVGEGGPSFAEQEAERSAHAQERVERRQAQAERRQRESEALFKEGEDAVKHIPFGQPVLVGHHSEARHRKALKKAQDKGFAGLEKHREAKAAASRARGTERRLRQRTDPGVTRRRLDRLQTELRKIGRNLHGHPGGGSTHKVEPATGEYRQRLLAMQADLNEQVAYWQAELAKLDDKSWSAADFHKGDLVQTRFGWATVLRVNPKTLTVDYLDPSVVMLNPQKVPYDRVKGRKAAPAAAAPTAPSKAPATPAPAKPPKASAKPAAKASKKKAVRKKTPKKAGPELPPLAKHDSYHFGPESHEAGSMRHDEQGFNVITAGLTTATLKTQAGAERWLKKKLRPEDWKAVRVFRARASRFGPVRKVEDADPILDKVERFVALLNGSPGIEPYRYEAHKRRKYIAIDRALPAARTRSGVFLVDADGHVYTIKGYGVPKDRITTLDEALTGKWQTRHGTPMRQGQGGPKRPTPAQAPKPASKPTPAPPTQTELSAGPRALQALELELSLSDPDTHQQLARLQSLLQWNRKTGAYDAQERPARNTSRRDRP